MYVHFSAGKTTTNEEIEDMLESGNLAVFTQDVRITNYYRIYIINTVDPDQTAPFDLGLHCSLRSICLITYNFTNPAACFRKLV